MAILSSKHGKRLFFGTVIVLTFTVLLVVEAWLARENYFVAAESLPMAGVGIALLTTVLSGIGCVELWRLARAQGLAPPLGLMILAVVAVATEPLWRPWYSLPDAALPGALLGISLLLAGLWQGFRRGNEGALGNLAFVCFSTIYLGLGSWFILQVRLLGASSATLAGQVAPLATFLVTVKSTDIAAYLIGRKIGRHKFSPTLSPGKTWEGCAAGLLVAIIVASIFSRCFGIMGPWRAVCFGLVVAVAGQLGDLFESMLKRDASIKDSANLVPEFGGALDVLDSIMVAAPFAYVILTCCTSGRICGGSN